MNDFDSDVDWSTFDTKEELTVPKETDGTKKFEEELYKKWFKSSNASGFISITPWYDAAKLAIDIGSVDPNTKKNISSTKCFVDMVDFSVYLNAVLNGQGEKLFPKRDQCPSPESFVSFGASADLSRVFKVHYWGADTDKEGDSRAFVFKCGHFGGTVTNTGATIPNFKDRKSANMIKVTRLELAEIAVRVQATLLVTAIKNNGLKA